MVNHMLGLDTSLPYMLLLASLIFDVTSQLTSAIVWPPCQVISKLY